MSERATAELIVHLGRIAQGDGFASGVTPAQWTALRYFASANRFSRTPSAFAEFHGTTRGTASQTVKSLVAQGYLLQTRSEADGRSIRLDLTDKARTILGHDPFEALVRAVGDLPPSVRNQVANGLERMLDNIARERCKRTFGTCASCEHLEGNGSCQDKKPPYRCGWIDEPLAESELQEVCINFASGRRSAQKPAFAERGQK